MARSRYEFSKVIKQMDNFDNSTLSMRLSTFPTILSDEIFSADDKFHMYTSTDRMDSLAYEYYGDGKYWWVICIANDLVSPFDKTLTPGKQLRIPTNIDKVFGALKNKTNKVK